MRLLLVSAAIVLLCQVVRAEDVQPAYLEYDDLRSIRDGFEEMYLSLVNVMSGARDEQSIHNKYLNNRMVSIYGSTVVRFLDERLRVQQAIDARTAAIGGTPNQCISEVQISFDNILTAAVANELLDNARLLAFDVNDINLYIFEGMYLRMQRQASGYKYRVITELAQTNLVTNGQEPLQQLAADLASAREDYKDAIFYIIQEISYMIQDSNFVWYLFSSRFDGIIQNYRTACQVIIDTLPNC